MSHPEYSLTITRTLAAPAPALYLAFTEPEVMSRWMGSVEADVRVGGRYRIESTDPRGETYAMQGEYRVLHPGRQVVMTFLAGLASEIGREPSPYVDEFIEITFEPLSDSRTELTLVNGWGGEALVESTLEATRAAWTTWLDRLASLYC